MAEKRPEQTQKFRELIEKMYKEFPNTMTSENQIKEVIVTEDIRDSLVRHGYFIRECMVSGGEEKEYYGLGPNSLNLISSWKTEKLTKKIITLTYTVLIVGVLALGTSIISVTINPNVTPVALLFLFLVDIAVVVLLISTFISIRS